MRIETMDEHIFSNVTYQVDIPEGTMFVSIIQDNSGKPLAIDIHIGKAGSTLQAWSVSFGRVLTMALDNGATINDLIADLSSQRSDKDRTTLGGVSITSGPEGVCYALMQHRKELFQLARESMGIKDDDDAARQGRGPRLAS